MRVRLAVVTLLIAIMMPLTYAGTTFETATWMEPDGGALPLAFTGNETFYVQYNTTQGKLYELRTTVEGNVDTYLQARWPNQALLAENQYDYAQPTGTESRIVFEAPHTGTFYGVITEAANRTGNAEVILTELGTLQPAMQTQPLTIGHHQTFEITTNVTCAGGPCGTVTAILDPIELPRGVRQQGPTAHVEIQYAYFDARTARQRSLTAEQELAIATLESLKNHPSVVHIEPNGIVHAMLDTSVPSFRADQAIQQTFNNTLLRGQDHTVCVIDTGVDYTHPDFGGCDETDNINDGSCAKVVGGYNFVENNNNPMDDNGHGTHVAATVASMHETYTGVAPDTKIVAMRALGTSGSGSFTPVRQSIDWCTSNAQALNITSIVMSLGTPAPYVNNCDYLSPEMRNSVLAAKAQNITVFAAAGNLYSSYPFLGTSFPACISDVITIGATSDAGAWSGYTKRDVMIDLIGPGNSVRAAAHEGGHVFKSGTSMATPHAAALGVLVQQRMQLLHGRVPLPDAVRNTLATSGVPRQDSATQPYSGLERPRIDAINATNAKGVVPMTPGATPFWTPTQNPDTCGDMQDGETCTHTWTVNATGTPGNYTFFTIYHNEYDLTETPRIIVTIAESSEDVTPPTTTDDAPVAWQNTTVLVTLDATDDDSGVNHTTYRLNEGSWENGTTVLVETEGNNTLEYYSVDNAGNQESVNVAHILLDFTPPATTDNAPAEWVGELINVTFSATDALSGVNYTRYRIDEGSWEDGAWALVEAEGETLVEYYSVDNAGNIEDAQNATVRIDASAPHTLTDATPTWQNDTVNVTFTATDALSGVNATQYRIDGGAWNRGTWTVVEAEGETLVEYYSVDNAQNTEDVRNVTVRIDRTPPATTDDAASTWYTTSATIALTPTDALSGVNTTRYRLNGGDWVLGTAVLVETEGNNTLEYYSIDNAGNTEEVRNATVAVDTVPPATTATAPTTWQNSSVTVKFSATDDTSGVAETRSRQNQESWTTGNTTAVETEGETLVEYYSVDAAGNTEAVRNRTVRIDLTPPHTTDNAPTGWQTTNVVVTLSATDAQSGVAETRWRLNQGSWHTGSTVFVDKEGNNTLQYYSVDSAGNQEEVQSVDVLIEQEGTTLSKVRPSSSVSTGEQATILFSAESASGIHTARLLSPQEENATLTGDTWRVNATFSAPGERTLLIRTTTAAGMTQEHTPTIVVYDQEESINTLTNQEHALPQTRTRLRVASSAPTANLTVRVANKQPPELSVLANARRFVNATVGSSTLPDWVILTVEYDETDIDGLDPSTLRLAYYNTTTQEWTEMSPGIPPHVNDVGVTSTYVWANLSKLSLYALVGEEQQVALPPQSPSNGGGGGGGGVASPGGGAAVLSEELSEDAEQTAAIRFFVAGEQRHISFSSERIPLRRAIIVPDEDGTVAQITAAEERETYVENQYAAFSITSNVSLQYADLMFAATQDTTLHERNGDSWTSLDTTSVGEGRYEARITRWGTYVIATPAPEPEPEPVQEVREEELAQIEEEEEQVREEEPVVVEEERNSWLSNGIPIPLFITGTALILLGLLVVGQRTLRKKLFQQ